MTSSPSSRPDSSDEDGKKKDLVGAIDIGISLTGDDEINKRFKACIQNDFPICLDEALQVIFGTSEKESVNQILQKARRTESSHLQNLTTPQGIWECTNESSRNFRMN